MDYCHPPNGPNMTTFQSEAVLKRDLFSETHKGHMADAPETPIIRRIVTASPWWTRVSGRRGATGGRTGSGMPTP